MHSKLLAQAQRLQHTVVIGSCRASGGAGVMFSNNWWPRSSEGRCKSKLDKLNYECLCAVHGCYWRLSRLLWRYRCAHQQVLAEIYREYHFGAAEMLDTSAKWKMA